MESRRGSADVRQILFIFSSIIMLAASLMVAAVLYGAGVILTGCIKKEEFLSKQKDVE